MGNQERILKWARDLLVANGYSVEKLPETVLSTPWSSVIRFSTLTGDIYLKQTPPSPYLSNEPKIIRLLSEKFYASVPDLIASNDDLHCFLMHDAGKPLREMLKVKFKPELLCEAIKQFATIQRSTEVSIQLLDYPLGSNILDHNNLHTIAFVLNHRVLEFLI